MSLEKQLIVDNETVISAKLLNDIQDAIIDNESQIELSKNKLNNVSVENLLDNSYFRNPVNQRGQTSYSTEGYTIDRWKTNNKNLNVVLTESGLQLTNNETSTRRYITQIVDRADLVGKILTYAICLNDGTVLTTTNIVGSYAGAMSGQVYFGETNNSYIAFNNADGKPSVWICVGWGETVNVKWACLYEGSYAAETLPPYVPKGYAAELLACNIAETGRVHDSDKLDGKEASLYLNKNDNDYIVDQGTSGIWGYRKWNSGLAECWFFVQHQVDSFEKAWGSLYESDEYFPTYDFPFHIYSIKSEALCPTAGLGIITAQRARNESAQASPPLIFMRPMNTTSGCKVRVGYYMIGTWKE